MEQNINAINIWIYFCLNYNDYKQIMKWICAKTHKEWLELHLIAKFDGDMNRFYCNIDKDLREALVEYALTIWAPKGMHIG